METQLKLAIFENGWIQVLVTYQECVSGHLWSLLSFVLASFLKGIPHVLSKWPQLSQVYILPSGQPQQRNHLFPDNSCQSPGIGSHWSGLVTCQSLNQSLWLMGINHPTGQAWPHGHS